MALTFASLQVHLLAKHISKTDDEIERVIARPTYFNPYEAVEFGIIDKVGPVSLMILTSRVARGTLQLVFQDLWHGVHCDHLIKSMAWTAMLLHMLHVCCPPNMRPAVYLSHASQIEQVQSL